MSQVRELSFEDLTKLIEQSETGQIQKIERSRQNLVGSYEGAYVYIGRFAVTLLDQQEFEKLGKPNSYEIRPKPGFELLGHVD